MAYPPDPVELRGADEVIAEAKQRIHEEFHAERLITELIAALEYAQEEIEHFKKVAVDAIARLAVVEHAEALRLLARDD